MNTAWTVVLNKNKQVDISNVKKENEMVVQCRFLPDKNCHESCKNKTA